MKYFSEKLSIGSKMEDKIRIMCSYNNAKYEMHIGHIIHIVNTNISFIEPHRVFIYKMGYQFLILIYDEDNIFIYERSKQISLKQVGLLLKGIKKVNG